MMRILYVLHAVDHDVGADEDSQPLEIVHVLQAVLHLLSIVQQAGYEGVIGLLHFPIKRAREHDFTNLVVDLVGIDKLAPVDRLNVPLGPG